MGYEVFIVGEEIDTSKYDPENFVIKDNKCVVTFDTREMAIKAVNEINKSEQNKALLYGEFKKILDQPIIEYADLEDISYEEILENQFMKDEQFVVVNDGNISVWKVKNEDVESEVKTQNVGSISLSNTGNFLVNFFNNKMKCFTQDFTKLFNDFYFDSRINKVDFSKNDTYLVVYTQYKVYIIDFYRGTTLVCRDSEKVSFNLDEEVVYFMNTEQSYNLKSESYSDFPKDLNIIENYGDQVFHFYKCKAQRITYSNGKYQSRKTQANIEEVIFGFTDTIGYAFISKKIKELFLYTLEIYYNDMIFLINFESKPVDYKVSDKMVLSFDTSRRLVFYKRSDRIFSRIKEIYKDGEVILSLSESVACVFDETSENLEFYDKGDLRSVYLHRGCTGLHWSKSGLYLAAISSGSGVLQLFNNNGKLLFKKVYNVFTDFSWRPFIRLSQKEKEKFKEYELSKYISELSISTADEYNLETLVANWKSFLIGKKRLLTK